MEWRDEGIALGTRKHGETSAILEVMTARHGRHLGLVRGGRSRRMQPVLQAGNRLELTWRARLDEHLGAFQVELKDTKVSQKVNGTPANVESVVVLSVVWVICTANQPEPLSVQVVYALDNRVCRWRAWNHARAKRK